MPLKVGLRIVGYGYIEGILDMIKDDELTFRDVVVGKNATFLKDTIVTKMSQIISFKKLEEIDYSIFTDEDKRKLCSIKELNTDKLEKTLISVSEYKKEEKEEDSEEPIEEKAKEIAAEESVTKVDLEKEQFKNEVENAKDSASMWSMVSNFKSSVKQTEAKDVSVYLESVDKDDKKKNKKEERKKKDEKKKKADDEKGSNKSKQREMEESASKSDEEVSDKPVEKKNEERCKVSNVNQTAFETMSGMILAIKKSMKTQHKHKNFNLYEPWGAGNEMSLNAYKLKKDAHYFVKPFSNQSTTDINK